MALTQVPSPMLAPGTAGNGPAFSAYQSAAQTIASVTSTKVQLQTKLFDTNTNFDAVTNYRFTPTVAGYYQTTGAFYFAFTGPAQVSVYKNGSLALTGPYGAGTGCDVTGLVYLNGSTDYVELYLYAQNGFTSTQFGAGVTYFQGALVRAA